MRIKGIYGYRHEGHSQTPNSYVLVFDDPSSDVPITYTAMEARRLGERFYSCSECGRPFEEKEEGKMPVWLLTLLKQLPTLIGIGRNVVKEVTKDDEEKLPPTALTYKDIEHIRAQEKAGTSHKVVPRKLDKENPYD